MGLIELIGVDNVLFGSDYPHPEGMSDPITFVDDLEGLPEEDEAKVMGGNLAPPHERRLTVDWLRDRPPSELPAASPPTSGELDPAAAERFGDRDVRRAGRRAAVLRRGRGAVGARWPGGCWPPASARAPRSPCSRRNSPAWIVGWLAATRIGGGRRPAQHLQQGRASWAGCCATATPRCCSPSTRHLGHDYLARLEEAVPGLADAQPEGDIAAVAPLPAVGVDLGRRRPAVGGAGRRPRRPGRPDVPDELLAAVEARGHAGRPDGGRVLVGQHRRPQGRGPHPRRRRPPRPQPLARCATWSPTTCSTRRCRCSGWAASASRSSPPCTPAPRLVFEEQFEPGATLDLIERERVTQVLGWPHMAKALVDHPTFADRDLSSLRGGSMLAPAPPAPPGRRRPAPAPTSLGHDRDARPAHLRAPRRRAAAGQGGLASGSRCRASSTGSSTRSRCEEVPSGEPGEVWVRGYSRDGRPPQAGAGRHRSPPTAGTAPATAGGSTRTGTSTSRAGWATSSSRRA